MNITDISISDRPVTRTIIKKNEITYYFSDVYFKSTKKILPCISIRIENWSKFDGKHFTSKLPFEKPDIKDILENEIEPFELIQEVFVENNILILKGYSSKSPAWIEYTFQNPNIKITSSL